MIENLTVAYKEHVRKRGPDIGFEFVYTACYKDVENHIFKNLSHWFDKTWWRCIDPADHKFQITQDTFMKFYGYNLRFFKGENKSELKNLWGLLCRMSTNKISEHFIDGICTDIPTSLTKNLDENNEDENDRVYQLPDYYGGKEMEDDLIFEQAKERLPITLKNALEDYVEGLSHEAISIKRGISIPISKKRRSMAIHQFRRYKGN